ncbi:hypothetical protein [Flavobacterium foetidum]|uniref:hypothetical protein n=1 Tax=Flavobacterium foetidum TaxID=2026681 RepID=UPI001074A434|nr:hypothetical protein [Flavobacterium foetidum]KAF2516557.1 hypothetical protein E0W73_05560 [Flavobacterium foetidum]
MKNIILAGFLLVLLASCSTTSNAPEKWVGQTKQKLIKAHGTPVRTIADNQQGEVLIYAEQFFMTNEGQNGSKIAGPSYWNYDYIFVNKEGNIYSWKSEKQKFPPQTIDSKKMVAISALK